MSDHTIKSAGAINFIRIKGIILKLIHLTHNSISKITSRQLENIFLMTIIIIIQSFNFQIELLNKGTCVSRFRVRVRVPGLLFNHQSCLR